MGAREGASGRRIRIAILLALLFAPAIAAAADHSAAAETPPAPPAPTNLTPPAISGAPEPGKVLTSSPGVWTQSPTAYSYEWEACPPLVSQAGPPGFGCIPIPGATAASYTVARN